MWARRKVGYLLDQIRANGQHKELVDEVTKLARRHRIATPYTSYLLVPDGVQVPALTPVGSLPDVRFDGQGGLRNLPGRTIGGMIGMTGGFGGGQIGMTGLGQGMVGMTGMMMGDMGMMGMSGGMMGISGGMGMGGMGMGGMGMAGMGMAGKYTLIQQGRIVAKPAPKVLDVARALRQAGFDGQKFMPLPAEGDRAARQEALRRLDVYLKAGQALAQGRQEAVQSGELGVNLSIETDKLRHQRVLADTGQRQAAGHDFQFVAGIWLDSAFKDKAPAVTIQAQSDAYFRILERRKEASETFRLGNRLVWMTPSGTALVIDKEGKTTLDDKEIERLFIPLK